MLDDDFVKLASYVSVDNEIPARMMFYSIMGAYHDNIKIAFGAKNKDVRLSLIWLQGSRSGKGQLLKVGQDTSTGLGLRHVTNTDFSTAGLIGSPNQTKLDFNIKYNLSPENPISATGRYHYQIPFDSGDIKDNDIIFFPEAKKAFARRSYSEDLLTDLQPTLDYPGYVRKKLKSAAIEYQCSPTYILTTYNYTGLTNAITEQGFFQRGQFYMRTLSAEDIKRMREMQDSLLGHNTQITYDKLLAELITKIKRIDNTKPILLTVSKAAIAMKKKLMLMFINRIENEISGDKFGIAMSFSQTIDDIILKTAAMRCVWRQGTQIESYDIVPTTMNFNNWVYLQMAKSIIEGLSLDDNHLKLLTRRALSVFVKLSKRVNKSTFQKILISEMALSYDKSRALINKLLEQNLLRTVAGDKNTKYLTKT